MAKTPCEYNNPDSLIKYKGINIGTITTDANGEYTYTLANSNVPTGYLVLAATISYYSGKHGALSVCVSGVGGGSANLYITCSKGNETISNMTLGITFIRYDEFSNAQ